MNDFIQKIKHGLCNIGVSKGDIVYIASDITLLLKIARQNYGVKSKADIHAFMDRLTNVFQDSVGEKGTLLFPVFTWEFCRGNIFDIKNTPGEVGAYNNWILQNRDDFKRTKHPIYSFMVWGKDTTPLISMNNIEAWGKDSPFAYLHKNKAKFLLLNVSLQRGFTFMHYVGYQLRVPYRYNKIFNGIYRDDHGKTHERCYSMYVRDLDIISHEYLPDSFMDKPGIMKKTCIDEINLKCIELAAAYDAVKQDLLYNGGQNCYIFDNYELDWTKGATHDDEISY